MPQRGWGAGRYNVPMVSVVHSVAAQSDFEQFFSTLAEGLGPAEVATLKDAVAYAWEVYGEAKLGSGERIWSHALGMAVIVAGLRLDADSRMAAVLFAVPAHDEHGVTRIDGTLRQAGGRPRSWHLAAQPPAADHQGLRRGQHRGR
jgi:hypothetical protein